MRPFASRWPWCALLGVFTAIAVAWLCALTSTCTSRTRQFVHSAPDAANPSAQQSWTWNLRDGFGIRWIWIEPGIFRDSPPDPKLKPPRWVQIPDQQITSIQHLASGWPLPCVNARFIERSVRPTRITRVAGARQVTFAWDYAYVIKAANPVDPFTAKILPLNPHVPELLINALFWAAMWYAALVVIQRAWRIIRTRHGVCPKCQYDLRGIQSDRCPECGAKLATTAVQSPNPPAAIPPA